MRMTSWSTLLLTATIATTAAAEATAPALQTPPPTGPSASNTEGQRPWRPNALDLDLGLGVVGLGYERFFERRVSAELEAQIFGTWFGPAIDMPNLRGFGGQLRPSFFLTDDGPRGLYLAPFLRLHRVTAEANGIEGHRIGWSTGAFLGWGFLFAERLSLRIGAGLQYMSYAVDVPTGPNPVQTTRVAFDTFFPAVDLVVGFVF
jgi:hypothetical protein